MLWTWGEDGDEDADANVDAVADALVDGCVDAGAEADVGVGADLVVCANGSLAAEVEVDEDLQRLWVSNVDCACSSLWWEQF